MPGEGGWRTPHKRLDGGKAILLSDPLQRVLWVLAVQVPDTVQGLSVPAGVGAWGLGRGTGTGMGTGVVTGVGGMARRDRRPQVDADPDLSLPLRLPKTLDQPGHVVIVVAGLGNDDLQRGQDVVDARDRCGARVAGGPGIRAHAGGWG